MRGDSSKKKKKIVGGEIMPARAIIFTIKRHVAMCKIWVKKIQPVRPNIQEVIWALGHYTSLAQFQLG